MEFTSYNMVLEVKSHVYGEAYGVETLTLCPSLSVCRCLTSLDRKGPFTLDRVRSTSHPQIELIFYVFIHLAFYYVFNVFWATRDRL